MLWEPEKRFLIVDSMALLFRGFYATSQYGTIMQTSEGVYTNAIYQYTKYLLNALEIFKPTHIACAMDMGKETFRNRLYPLYKANRQDPPPELIPQFALIKDLLEAFDIPVYGIEGYEAEDIIGTLAKKHADENVQVLILTGDGDTLQLLEKRISVLMMKKGFGNYDVFTLDNFTEKKRLHSPGQIIDLKGLMGDASDNIPGCPQIGPKTAEKLLLAYQSIDGVFSNLNQIQGKIRERLAEHKKQIYLSRELATIQTGIPLESNLEDCACRFNHDKIKSAFARFEFQSLMKWLA